MHDCNTSCAILLHRIFLTQMRFPNGDENFVNPKFEYFTKELHQEDKAHLVMHKMDNRDWHGIKSPYQVQKCLGLETCAAKMWMMGTVPNAIIPHDNFPPERLVIGNPPEKSRFCMYKRGCACDFCWLRNTDFLDMRN